jgi:RNA polymerase sigma-70 factor, ECF subfamily
MQSQNELEQSPDDCFVQLLAQNQLRLRAYIFTLVRDCSDADDVLQDASIALWKKRATFDPSRDFFRWACGVALIEVLRFRRKSATDKLQFDEALISTLAEEYLEYSDECDRRRAALPHCLKKLSDQDRWLVGARYSAEITVAQIAEQLGRPLSTVYSSLVRIRETLFRCVQQAISREAHPPSIAD